MIFKLVTDLSSSIKVIIDCFLSLEGYSKWKPLTSVITLIGLKWQKKPLLLLLLFIYSQFPKATGLNPFIKVSLDQFLLCPRLVGPFVNVWWIVSAHFWRKMSQCHCASCSTWIKMGELGVALCINGRSVKDLCRFWVFPWFINFWDLYWFSCFLSGVILLASAESWIFKKNFDDYSLYDLQWMFMFHLNSSTSMMMYVLL